jgi:23S rRNA pseudouridine2605 synthase
MKYHEFMQKPERLQKILADFGVASRRKSEVLISEGRVRVNGKVAKIGDKALGPDKITVDGKTLKRKEKPLYFAFNKPRGYVVSETQQGTDPTIFDLIKIPERIFPVGRLDKDSQGLIILTNDGDLAQKISHPKGEIRKRYEVTVERKIEKSDTNLMERGISLSDEDGSRYSTKGTVVTFVQNPKKVIVEIGIGRYHVIRKMFGHFGYAVTKLKRISIGGVTLGGLELGALRPLTNKELACFREEF